MRAAHWPGTCSSEGMPPTSLGVAAIHPLVCNPTRGGKWLVRGASVLVLLAAGGARAQELPGFELERLELNPSAQGSLLLGTETLAEGALRVALLGHYARNPFSVFRGDGQPARLVRQRVTAHLQGAYAPLPWLELGLQVPAVAFLDSGDMAGLGLQPPARSGLSTPTVSVRVGPLSQRHGDALDLALGLGVGLPLGSAEAYARDSGLRLGPKLMVGFPLGTLRAGAELGALLRPSVSFQPGTPATVGSELHAALGLALGEEGGLQGELGARTTFSLVRGAVGVEGLAGLRYPVSHEVELLALGGVGFGSLPGTPLFRVLAGVSVSLGDAPPPEVLPLPSQRSTGEASRLVPPPPPSPPPEVPVSEPIPLKGSCPVMTSEPASEPVPASVGHDVGRKAED